jgi:hypothetical protein
LAKFWPITVIAVFGGIALVGLCLLAIVVLNRIGIALERHPLKLVRGFFRQHYPQESIGWLRLAADEPSRWVVGVFYGSMRPRHYKFFVVNRATE